MSLATTEEVGRAYFAARPPFAAAGPKKSEFPDAIALISLENWARHGGKRVLAVSRDAGWAAFAQASDHIDVEEDLAKALETLQEHVDAGATAISTLLGAVERGEEPDQASDLRRLLERSVGNWRVHAEAQGSYSVEVDSVDLRLVEYSFDRHGNRNDVTVVRLGRNEAVARVAASFKTIAQAEFSLGAWDSIDREYLSMGNSSAEQKVEFEGHVLITITGDLAGPRDEVSIKEADLVDGPRYLYFGEVDPEFGDAEDDFEIWPKGQGKHDAVEDIASEDRPAADRGAQTAV